MVYTNCEYFSVKSTRTQVYFCMIVQGTLLDVVNHYQVILMTVYWEQNFVFIFKLPFVV